MLDNQLGVYLFGAIPVNTSKTFGEVKLAGEQRGVYTIPYKETAMVVADAPVQVYDPSRANLKAHQDVVNLVMEQHTIVPMSFGNVLESEQDVTLLLEQLQEQLMKIFPQIENRIEVGLKIIGHKQWIEQAAQAQPELKQAQENIAGKSKEAGYYERIQLGEAARKFMLQLQKQCEAEIFTPLTELAVSSKSNEVIGERMLLNASFLIDLDKETAFDQKVNELYEQWEGKVDFKYTGPWPAYNFIDIKLKAADVS
ncbi:GvpL/GvpF family gas vesicle protein [Sediminibacillus albus]|uniref:Gas vesicle synthesis protein GvpL/GvpF n=1 Tax=Sediminibacillus albus TaxID=407036 RepID=A0A1G8Y679_9BACI|nr:GvpL/GvpF family gas vesicle protein [Sediminibacillus albus]SDJ97665.1 Gas vesicle synthesis protein GvpL/GvpF [Sediminibacillus albus]